MRASVSARRQQLQQIDAVVDSFYETKKTNDEWDSPRGHVGDIC